MIWVVVAAAVFLTGCGDDIIYFDIAVHDMTVTRDSAPPRDLAIPFGPRDLAVPNQPTLDLSVSNGPDFAAPCAQCGALECEPAINLCGSCLPGLGQCPPGEACAAVALLSPCVGSPQPACPPGSTCSMVLPECAPRGCCVQYRCAPAPDGGGPAGRM